MDDFNGSIAQQYISFSSSYSVTTVPGDNYYTPLIFVGSGEAANDIAGAYFTSLSGVAPTPGTEFIVNSSNYASQIGGRLGLWLSEFYQNNAVSSVGIVVYDDASTVNGTIFPTAAVSGLTTQFNAYHQQGYFKTMSMPLKAANVALATLCQSDPLLSQCWINVDAADNSDALTPGSTTDVYYLNKQAGNDPVMVYSAQTVTFNGNIIPVNGVLSQLGVSLGVLNNTGTSVGNSLDYVVISAIGPSGPNGTSLTPSQITILTNKNIGFFLYLGNTTGNVALRGGKTLNGDIAGADWLTDYIDFVCAVQVTNYIATLNHYKNVTVYSAILSILTYYINQFTTLGRLSNASITAPPWATVQPLSGGDSIVIPNAWQATYNDNVRNVVVQGTLYI